MNYEVVQKTRCSEVVLGTFLFKDDALMFVSMHQKPNALMYEVRLIESGKVVKQC